MSSKFAARHRKPIAAVGLGIRSTATQADASVPTITSGSGAPSASEVDGSLYLRTNGAVYNRIGSAWELMGAADVADPGDAGAIPVTQSASVAITTAGAETRTLAIPTFIGQRLSICLDTDGGDCVITVASAVNQTGNNTLTGADAGDHISLEAITVGGTLAWRVLANDGWALSTV
jgi:hypothetical protein